MQHPGHLRSHRTSHLHHHRRRRPRNLTQRGAHQRGTTRPPRRRRMPHPRPHLAPLTAETSRPKTAVASRDKQPHIARVGLARFVTCHRGHVSPYTLSGTVQEKSSQRWQHPPRLTCGASPNPSMSCIQWLRSCGPPAVCTPMAVSPNGSRHAGFNAITTTFGGAELPRRWVPRRRSSRCAAENTHIP